MEVKTKFNVGDKFYCLEEFGEVSEDVVCGMRIEIDGHGEQVIRVCSGNTRRYYKEECCFKTVQELYESVKANIENYIKTRKEEDNDNSI